MNKNVLSYDKKAVDDEIERLKPLIALGGTSPSRSQVAAAHQI